MTQEQHLTKYELLPPMTVTELRNLAMDFAKSGYFQSAKEAAQAAVLIQAGRELGIGPVQAMTKIYIVKGKVTIGAELMGAMIKRTGRYDYHVTEYTDKAVTLEFTDGGKKVFTSRFTEEDAKKADLVKADSGWSKWPRAMLMSKALSQGARIVCPHVIAGTYTPEDFGNVVNPDTGEVVTGPVTITEVKPEEQPQPATAENPAPDALMSDKQRKALFAKAREIGGYDDEDWKPLRALMHEKTGKNSLKELTIKEGDELIAAVERGESVKEDR